MARFPPATAVKSRTTPASLRLNRPRLAVRIASIRPAQIRIEILPVEIQGRTPLARRTAGARSSIIVAIKDEWLLWQKDLRGLPQPDDELSRRHQFPTLCTDRSAIGLAMGHADQAEADANLARAALARLHRPSLPHRKRSLIFMARSDRIIPTHRAHSGWHSEVGEMDYS